jgi:DnaJ-class molecular chaperone
MSMNNHLKKLVLCRNCDGVGYTSCGVCIACDGHGVESVITIGGISQYSPPKQWEIKSED